MALVIQTNRGNLVLPKFNFQVVYKSGPSYIPATGTEEYHLMVLNNSLRFSAEFSLEYFESLVTPERKISQTKNYYLSSSPYKLKNGWELYLNVFQHYPDYSDIHGRAFAFCVYNPETDALLSYATGFSTVIPENADLFLPAVYMFQDSSGDPYICYMTKTKHNYQLSPRKYGYGICPSAIEIDRSETEEIYKILFTDIDNADDPYWQGGDSHTGGGTGTFGDTGDTIGAPSLPTLSSADTGLITLFNPTISQLHDLANYLWSDLFDINTFKKVFANPMDAILGLSIVPVSVPNGGAAEVTVGNISTGVSMTKAASQYVTVDCGTLNVKEFWGAYLDYDPYTKCEIYLPYIGTHAVAVDDIMNKAVHVIYHVDILSGACCAFVECNGTVLYTFVGQCTASIPITGNDWTNVLNGALSIAASIGTMVATGGATAPMAAATIASTAVNTFKPSVEKSGSMGGMGGMLGVQTPYLILTRPRQALPKYQNRYTGYPSFITLKLVDCVGYTEVENIHLENIPATESELSEIETLLKGGVII